MAAKKKAPDPVRLLKLLWRDTGPDVAKARHGPKPSLSVDRLVQAAIALADAEGLSALTIRRVAQDLGVAPMSVYTYVATKDELIELMIDAVCQELQALPRLPQDWRNAVTTLAHDNLALYHRHPWLSEFYASERPPLGPGLIAKYERELAAFEGLGLSDLEMDAALSFVLNFVNTAAREARQAMLLSQVSATSSLEWWQSQEATLIQLMPPGTYPLAERVGSAAGEQHGAAYAPDFAWRFGLARVLDGLAGLIKPTSRLDQPP